MNRPLPVGRVSGFRGLGGELTVRVASGDAGRWRALTAVLVGDPAEFDRGEPARFEVERSRAYRDRLVLKLKGVDDPSRADSLKGRWILAPAEQVPVLPKGVYWVERLMALEVIDERGESLGRVEDVIPTGGVDLLVVRDPGGGEILVPLADSIVLEIDEPAGRVRVSLPEGLVPGKPRGEGERR
ncbi:MAG: ribosome maturation factor RimM [Acidobacteriia bacterium]|nr:ribosome maturation factor RimM [Terriglobia bacterium]